MISSVTGSPASTARRIRARACSAAGRRGRSPLPGSSMVAVAKPSVAACWARATSRGYTLPSPSGGGPSRISGTGADTAAGVHRMPGIPSRVNSRSTTPSSRRRSEVKCMVVPFGSAHERRSRTAYRPTVTPEESTHVDTAFTGTTSSFSRTASGKVAAAAAGRQAGFAGEAGAAASSEGTGYALVRTGVRRRRAEARTGHRVTTGFGPSRHRCPAAPADRFPGRPPAN